MPINSAYASTAVHGHRGDRRLFDDICSSLRRIEDKLDGQVDKPGR